MKIHGATTPTVTHGCFGKDGWVPSLSLGTLPWEELPGKLLPAAATPNPEFPRDPLGSGALWSGMGILRRSSAAPGSRCASPGLSLRSGI